MKRMFVMLVGIALLGCRERPAPEPGDKPLEKPTAVAGTNTSASSVGGAISDVLTQRPVIEAGLRAKAQVEAASARENKNIEEALQE